MLTYVQKTEFDGINALRRAYGLDPYVFDSELASDTVYVGCSHTYRDDVPFNGLDSRVVEFDVFARDLTTALNPK